MFGKIHIGKHQRGLWFRDGDFHKLLEPGDHRLWALVFRPVRNRVEIVDTLETRFDHKLFDALIDEPELRKELVVVDLKDHECAFIWKDGRLAYILGSGRHAFWKRPADLEVERFDVDDFEFEHARSETVRKHPRRRKGAGRHRCRRT